MQGLQGKFDFESLGKGVLHNLRQVSPAAGVCPFNRTCKNPSCMIPRLSRSIPNQDRPPPSPVHLRCPRLRHSGRYSA